MKKTKASSAGLKFPRHYTKVGVDPFDTVEWATLDAVITDENGESVFEQLGVEFPARWSQTAVNIVASKYFRGALGTPERERSCRALVRRVVDAITAWGRDGGYFAGEDEAVAFRDELVYVLLHQVASFNSPVWFNVGTEKEPQCSACFINSVQDDMGSIMDLAKTEAMIFKHGSGAGVSLSGIRSSREGLSGGGTASGPVSFMGGLDAFAGAIKSGGKTRRAAKMVVLDVDHPDVEEFIRCKAKEEGKAQALIDAGWSPGFTDPGGAYESVGHQNANHSVRAGDDFMRAVADGGTWTTRAVTDGKDVDTCEARDLMRAIAESTWACGDPGMQFSDTISSWHTCPESGPIRASNPCSEFVFLDDSACNLASINLLTFLGDPPVEPRREAVDNFDVGAFQHVCRVMISAQEMMVSNAGYPTEKIAEMSKRFRPLGLGYSNLGALLMACGLPYDSDAGRGVAASLTALMTSTAYAQSGAMAAALGPFDGFKENREAVNDVLRKHGLGLALRSADLPTAWAGVPSGIVTAAVCAMESAIDYGVTTGIRNAQVSVLAPTGTIAFMMDCDTTGIEPAIALVSYKKLVGGGSTKIVNGAVRRALVRLGYAMEASEIVDHIEETDTIEGVTDVGPDDLPVFDCAMVPRNGERSIAPMGHLKMMAAVQPFLSGAISKTVNVPAAATVEEIQEIYMAAWRMGIKAVAIYRDGCKSSQPVTTARPGVKAPAHVETRPVRRRLPDERQALTHRFTIGQHKGYITVGLYGDGTPGELFIEMSKEGSTISGLIDAFAIVTSIGLQYGVPIEVFIKKLCHTRFEPSGFTSHPEIRIARSINDYIARWLALKFLDADQQAAAGLAPRPSNATGDAVEPDPDQSAASGRQSDAPGCHVCGSIMVRIGTCYECFNCGASTGCG